jgi:tetratricopeptide (TPR) repeat protein
LEQKQQLCDLLLQVRALHDPDLRNLYVSELELQLDHSLSVPRHIDARHAVWAILNACLPYDGALRSFVRILRGFHGENSVVLTLQQLVDDLEKGPILTADQRDALAALLAGVSVDYLTAAYHDVVEPVAPHQQPNWQDPAAVIRRLETCQQAEGPVPPLLVFVDRLAHLVAKERLNLHRWLDAVGVDLGLDQNTIRQICVATQRHLAEPVSEMSLLPGDSVNPTTITLPSAGSEQSQVQRLIWGGVPIRNPSFTGREGLMEALHSTLTRSSKASVLPETLHGLGGVGKTQLVVEYIYREAHKYDLVWWIAAEQPTQVRASLATLGERLGLPASQDMQQTATAVLDALGASQLRWLLVYDNADLPEDVMPLLPSAGGHVIVTSRNHAWAAVGDAIEVDVFKRSESIELLRKHGETISPKEADQLAEKLGDLPLALEQAATWHAATGMPIAEYLQLFDRHVHELLAEGRPTSYSSTVYAFLRVAFERLRQEAPAAAELLELFAFLGPEPVSVTLLRCGKNNSYISESLSQALHEPIFMNRTIRELRRYGLAKVDPNGQRIQVHRLVQLVLREELRSKRRDRSKTNVQELLASANPGDPDETQHWPLHAEIGPHIRPAGLIEAGGNEARRVVLDQMRYLFRIGDYEGSRELGEATLPVWSAPAQQGGLGPDHEFTLIANRHYADALRQVGEIDEARRIDEETLKRLRESPEFGVEHEHTLYIANSVGVDLRISGEYRKALDHDAENLKRHRRVYGEEDQHTLRTKSNLAVNMRLLGDFEDAHKLDLEALGRWRQTLGDKDTRTIFSINNLVRDLYGLGQYAEALEIQLRVWSVYRDQLGPSHSDVLLAARTIAIARRKTGEYKQALGEAREAYRSHHARFGPSHQHTLVATMSYANSLRVVGELVEAKGLTVEAINGHTRVFGPKHPLTLAAQCNLAIILRALGERHGVRAMDEETLKHMGEALGAEHPYTLCVANNLTNDLVVDHNVAAARELSQRTLAASRRVRGDLHPYTLACATNAAFDLQATGEEAAGQRLFDETIATLGRTLGTEHPEVLDAGRGKRAECDIEPPPT